MKKRNKKKYDNLKPDGKAYEELISDYEQAEMPDYSFKNNAQAMGKNAKKLRNRSILRIVLAVIGAIVVLYFGYFVVEVIKQVNSRPNSSTAQEMENAGEYMYPSAESESTVPSTESSTEQYSTTEDTSL